MNIIRKDIFGYYESADDEKPTHDPGIETICLICAKKLYLPVKTISLMRDGDSRSYFYRTHKSCYESSDYSIIHDIEGSLISNIKLNNHE